MPTPLPPLKRSAALADLTEERKGYEPLGKDEFVTVG